MVSAIFPMLRFRVFGGFIFKLNGYVFSGFKRLKKKSEIKAIFNSEREILNKKRSRNTA